MTSPVPFVSPEPPPTSAEIAALVEWAQSLPSVFEAREAEELPLVEVEELGVAVLVTPPLSLMGETFSPSKGVQGC